MDDMTDQMTKYRDCVRRIVEGHAHPSLHPEQVETQIVTDEKHDHYLLLYVGWRGNQRVRGIVLHLDIKEGRIWVQHDGTEYGVANELVEMGIPKADIVLGFRAPHRRRDTDFGA